MERFDHRIAGEWVSPGSGEYIPSYEPATGQPWAEIAGGSAADIDRAVEASSGAGPQWRDTAPRDRANVLWRIGDLIEQHADELADAESRDIGKVIREMKAQMKWVAD